MRFDEAPVEPRHGVVLAPGIVVALLRPATLVAIGQHRYALAQEQRGEHVSHLPRPHRLDLGPPRRPLDTVVVREVVVVAVAIPLVVGLVVLLPVTHQVVEREAVVRGHEVDAVAGLAAVVGVEVAGARQPRGQVAGLGEVAPPVAADVVAVAAVPLGPPQPGERAHLIGARCVPGLRDDLGVGEGRILGDHFHDRRIRLDVAVAIAAQHARQVEAKAIDVVVVHPVTEAEEDQLADDRMVAVDRVAAAGVVAVGRAAITQHVVHAVLEPLEGERGAEMVALGGVVEDHVEDHLDPGRMQGPHHLLELADLRARSRIGRVAAMRREEGDRVVAPEVFPCHPFTTGHGGRELVHGHQLHRGHPERLEVRDLLDHAQVRSRMRHAAGGAGREPANVHLVDHGIGEAATEVAVAPPIESVVDDHALWWQKAAVSGGRKLPDERLGIRVDQPGSAVEPLPRFRVERPVCLQVVELSCCEARHEHAPDIPPPVARGIERDDLGGFARRDLVVEQDPHRRGRPAVDDELHAGVAEDGAVRERLAELQRWERRLGERSFGNRLPRHG